MTIDESVSSITDAAGQAATAFKGMQIALMVFSLVVTVGIIIIVIKISK